jgi:large subunit ribosomal protein L24e
MVEKRECSFCGSDIEPGTGMLFIRRDGTRHEFCSSKCRRNLLDLKRVPRTVKWSKHYVKGAGPAAVVTEAPDEPPAAAATTAGTTEPAAAKPAPAKAKAAKPPASPKAPKAAASPKGGSSK